LFSRPRLRQGVTDVVTLVAAELRVDRRFSRLEQQPLGLLENLSPAGRGLAVVDAQLGFGLQAASFISAGF
jgi:hypothetical protein